MLKLKRRKSKNHIIQHSLVRLADISITNDLKLRKDRSQLAVKYRKMYQQITEPYQSLSKSSINS